MVKINKGFEINNFFGEHLVMAMGENNVDFTSVIVLNESSYYLWQQMEQGTDTVEALVKALMEEYEVDEATATNDVNALIGQLLELGVVSHKG